jgi:hypothetical protein
VAERPKGYEQCFPDLGAVLLEDSWVLELRRTSTGLVFELDAHLTSEHPQHGPPALNEWACYRRGHLTIDSDRPAVLVRSETRPTTDPDGTIDYGNIDTFEASAEIDGAHTWQLAGDWGQALVINPKVSFRVQGQ